MDTISGSCLCGSVRFSVTPPTLFCAHCHCRFCRKAHGAALVTWFGAAEERFALDSDEHLRWYQSSKQSRRGFCSRCGSTLLFTSKLAPGEVHIARAFVDGAIDREPMGHVFFDHHVDWLEITDELPRYDSSNEALAKYCQIEEL